MLGVAAPYWVYGAPSAQKTVLFVHGLRGDHHGLEGIAEELVKLLPDFRVVIPDLPGFGEHADLPGRSHNIESFALWLKEFYSLVTPGAPLLAHSFGTIVSTCAVARGLTLPRLVLLNPIAAPALAGPQQLLSKFALGYYRLAAHLGEAAGRALLANPLVTRGMSEIMAKTHERKLRRWIHSQHALYFSNFASVRGLSEAFDASISHNVLEYARLISCPTLLVAGELDDITPTTAQLRLERTLPHAKLYVLPGTGHLVHYEAVADVASLAATFLGAGE